MFLTKDRFYETLVRILDPWLAEAEVDRETGEKLKEIQCDGATEFLALKEHLGKPKSINVRMTEAYTPAQNGPAERLNRFLLEKPVVCSSI